MDNFFSQLALALALVLVLAFVVGLGIWLVALSFRTRLTAWRLSRVAAVPFIVGGTTLLVVAFRFGEDILHLIPDAYGGLLTPDVLDPPIPLVLILGALIIGAAFAEIGAASLPAGLTRLFSSDSVTVQSIIRLALVGVITIGSLGAAAIIDGRLSREAGTERSVASILFEVAIPGNLTDAEPLGDNRVLGVTGEGQVLLLTIGPDAKTSGYEVVADGLSFPQGIAVLDGVAYVSDQGALHCENPFPSCLADDADSELENIRANEGKVVAFDLAGDGTLSNRRVVVDGLPVVNSEHALHDIETGPDGRLYLSIGGVARLGPEPERVDALADPKVEYIGTVVSFLPEGRDLQIHARGIRNVYGMAFNDDGALLGVDNDGPSGRDWKREELLDIRSGADFGFPRGGSQSVDRDPAIAILDGRGSAGFEWAERVGLDRGVLVGDVNSVDFIPLERDAQGFYVQTVGQSEILQTFGFVSVLEALPDGRLLVGVFQGFSSAENGLLVLGFDTSE